MKHLDEGTLQAWLDMPRSGLEASEVAEIERHVATCETCAAALAALRDSDGGVHGLLVRGLDKSVEAPPFEEIVARAEGRTGGQGRTGGGHARLGRLAWAASIVVAIGVGWMTNELYRGGPPSPTSTQQVAPARAPEADQQTEASAGADVVPEEPSAEVGTTEEAPDAAAPEATITRDVPSASGARGTVPPADVVEAEPGTEPAVVGDAVADRDVARQRPLGDSAPADDAGPDDAAAADAAAAAPALGRTAAAPAPAAQAVPGLSVPAGQTLVRGTVRDADGQPVASAQVFVERLNVGALSQENGSYTLFIPDSALDSLPLDLTVQRIGFGTETRAVDMTRDAVAVIDFTIEEQPVQLQEVVVTGQAGQTQRRALGNAVSRLTAAPAYDWQPDTREAVEAALGEPLVIVPGLEIMSVEWAELQPPETGNVARVRQRLAEDGTVLTLIEGRSSDESRAAWELDADGALESTRVAGVLVTGTAPVQADSLRTLLDALR